LDRSQCFSLALSTRYRVGLRLRDSQVHVYAILAGISL